MTDARDWQSDAGTRSAGRPRRSAERAEGGADPTDPEVPDAKRRRALRRRRSMVVAATAVAGLVVTVLLLLFRMGRQVTNGEVARDDISSPAAPSAVGGAGGPIITLVTPAPAPSTAPQTIATGSTGAPLPRAKPQAAPDIFRKPAF